MQQNWFVGLEVEAARWFEPLVADAPSCVHVLHPGDLHATVAFFGGVGEEAAMRAWHAISEERLEIFDVALGGVAPMGNPRRPSALSVLLTDGREVAASLIARLRPTLIDEAGAKPDTRPPKPHITIARPHRNASAAERRRAVAWAEGKEPIAAQIHIARLALYTWSEDRRARQFRIVASRQLVPK